MTNPTRLPSVDFERDGLRIVSLNARRLLLFLDNQPALCRALGLPEQAIENIDELIELTRGEIVSLVKNEPHGWLYFTRWLSIEVKTGLVVADFMIKTGLDSSGAVEIGYGTHTPFLDKGFMTRTIAVFLEWAKTESPILRVKAETHADNEASIRVLEKNGFAKWVDLGESIWWEWRV